MNDEELAAMTEQELRLEADAAAAIAAARHRQQAARAELDKRTSDALRALRTPPDEAAPEPQTPPISGTRDAARVSDDTKQPPSMDDVLRAAVRGWRTQS